MAKDNANGHYVFSSTFPVAIGGILLVPEWKLGTDAEIIAMNEKTGLSFMVKVHCWGGAKPVAFRMLNHIGTPTKIFADRG